MDSKPADRSKWSWLPAAMPGVARLMGEKRTLLGNAHVNQCWQRGVIEQQPGWLFAREGGLAVGTPWGDWQDVAFWQEVRTEALLIMREPEGGRG